MRETFPTEASSSDQKTGPKQPEDLIEKYSVIRDALDLKPSIVYHPCGAYDCSPSAVFPDSRVVYVDTDEESMAALQEAGYETHTADATEFDPGPVDLLILLNPAISSSGPASHVGEKGFVITNDYHSNASELYRNPNFDLRGFLREDNDGEYIFDKESAAQYWEGGDVDTEEAFITNHAFDTFYKGVVEKYGDPSKGYLSEYKRLCMEIDPGGEGIGFYKGDLVPLAGLPRKASPHTGLFVFQKIGQDSQEAI